MDDKMKQAYELLGLSEPASKEDVEKRYYLLQRKLRAQQLRSKHEDAEDTEELDGDAISAAYRLIMGIPNPSQGKAQQATPKNAKERWEHWRYYYKYHALAALFVLLIGGLFLKSYLDQQAEQDRLSKLPPPEATVMFVGNYGTPEQRAETKPLEEALLSYFPAWKRISVILSYSPDDLTSEYDLAAAQKTMIDLMNERPDLYIVDQKNYEKLMKAAMFRPLDQEAETLLSDEVLRSQDLLQGTTNENQETHIYGIDLSDSKLAERIPLEGQQWIAAIRFDSKHKSNSVEFIERMLE